ncbi:MAG: hypothetical protein A2Z15_05490, partial [Chloroflexi bacterium RBG_16_50_11]
KKKAESTMLSTGEVARIFEVHPGTIRRWCALGKLKAYRSGQQGGRRFRREDVAVAFLERTIKRYFRTHARGR